MTHIRPIASDDRLLAGGSLVAAHQSPVDRATPGRTPVTHSFATVAFFTGGHARVEQNGDWKLAEGDVLLVPAGGAHRMLELRRAEFWGLALCVPCFTADRTGMLLEPFERVRDGASAVVHVPAARHAFLEGLFRELEEVGRTRRVGGDALDAIQRSLLTLIVAEIDRAAGSNAFGSSAAGLTGDSSASRGAPRVGGVVVDSLRFIERNCLQRLTLNDIAAAVGRTPTYVTTALKQSTGRSAGDWIVVGRMAEARRLLLHSDERVDVIAERVGYADSTHFIRMFRRAHGVTPAAWRVASSASQ